MILEILLNLEPIDLHTLKLGLTFLQKDEKPAGKS